jgi:hypothetical protein
MYQITVNGNPKLTFRVLEFKVENERIIFTDSRSGLMKNFPHELCYIEEVKQ